MATPWRLCVDHHGGLWLDLFGQWERLGDLSSDDLTEVLASDRCRVLVEAIGVHSSIATAPWPVPAHGAPAVLEFRSGPCPDRCPDCTEMGPFAFSERSLELDDVLEPSIDEAVASLLATCSRIVFAGGEAFAGKFFWRLAAMAAPHPLDWEVTTAGTVDPPALDTFLREHRCAFEVVLAGTSAATVEAIMPGSNQERVMASIDRLRAHCSEVGTRLSVVFPLMRENWPELGDVLLLADRWEADVEVCHVTAPRSSSLATLPATFRQEEVVRSLRRREQTLRPRLSRNRHVWDAALASLDDTDESHQIRAPEAPPRQLAAMGLARGFPDRRPSSGIPGSSPMAPAEARSLVAAWTDGPILTIDADAGDVVRSVSVEGKGFLGVDDSLLDQPFPLLVARLNEHQGVEATSVSYHVEPTWCAWSVLYAALDHTVHVRALTLPVYRSDRLTGTTTVAGLWRAVASRARPPRSRYAGS